MSLVAALFPSRNRALARRGFLALVACWLPFAVRAAADDARSFDLPGGEAAEMLKRAARIGGVQVVFVLNTVEGVKTNSVHGRFPLREALDRMLARTGLIVVWDAKASAFSIERTPAAPQAGAETNARAQTSSESMKSNSRSLFSVLAGWMALAVPAGAQTASPAAPRAAETINLSAFIVTGSNIPTAADAVAVPVTIINQSEIERTGLGSNLLEVLQTRLPSFSGSGNLGATNGNTGSTSTYGGSQVSLRNLSTLVLLDGRRVPDNGASARGGRAFVDVNQFPLAAIQTVEVLTDGASAIYGSDAVGGVVNVKLRHDFHGLEAGGRYATSTRDGNLAQQSAYLVAGVKTGPMSLTFSYSQSRTSPLYQSERPFSNPQTGKSATISGALGQSSTAFPTAFLRPDLASPSRVTPTGPAAVFADLNALVASGIYQASSVQPIADTFDLAPFVTLTIESRKRAFTLAGAIQIIPDRLEFFLEGINSFSDSNSQLGALGITTTVPVNAPYNPTRSSLFAAFRYTPAVRRHTNLSELRRLVGGFRGKLGNRFSWEAGYNHNLNRLDQGLSGQFYAPNLQLSLAGGYDAGGNRVVGGRYARVFRDFGAPPGTTTLAQWQAALTPDNSVLQPAFDLLARPAGVDPASLANISGTTANVLEARLTQLDARVSGPLLDLPAGPLGAAAGIDFRTEKLLGQPDANSYATGPTAQRWQSGNFYDPISRQRTIDAAFAEIRIPVTSERMGLTGLSVLELSAAYRYEKYSDAGASRVPKYGVRWRPAGDELTFRGTYSEAFVAPSLFALFGPTTQSSTAAGIIQTVFGLPGFARQRTGANADLKPSTADTRSLGVVYSPRALPGLTLGLDYVDVRQRSLIGTAGAAEILRSVNESGPKSPYASQVAIGNFPTNPDPILPAPTPVTAPGQLAALLNTGVSPNVIFLTDSRINISGQKVKALDVSANYAFPKSGLGRFNVSATGTFFLHYQFQALPTQRYYEYAGHVTNIAGGQGTLPGMKWFTALSWSRGPWAATLNHTYVDQVVDIGAGGLTFETSTTLKRIPVPSYSSWDTSVSYTFRKPGPASWLRLLTELRLTLGVNNLADRMPPSAPQAFGSDVGADLSTYNPIGRLWYLSAGLKF